MPPHPPTPNVKNHVANAEMTSLVSPNAQDLELPHRHGAAGSSHVLGITQLRSFVTAAITQPARSWLRSRAPLNSQRERSFVAMLRRRSAHFMPTFHALFFRACHARQPFAIARELVKLHTDTMTELARELLAVEAPTGRSLEVMRSSITIFSAFASCMELLFGKFNASFNESLVGALLLTRVQLPSQDTTLTIDRSRSAALAS